MQSEDNLRALALAATPGPWEWHTSCSWKRLYQAGNRKPARVIEPYVCSDGHPDISISKEDMDFIVAANPAAVLNLIRERDEAREERDGYRLAQSLDKDSAYVIRELLNRHNVPPAAFIDDHVANAIAQRDAAEAALSAAHEDVGRLRKALERIRNLDEADGHDLTWQHALEAVGIAHQALTQEPHHG